MTTSMTVEEMREHVDRLVAELRTVLPDLRVHWVDERSKAMVSPPRELHLPKIRSAIDYAICLHEIGHLAGRYQRSKNRSTRERWATVWARQHALFWTQEMEDAAQSSLDYYRRLKRKTLFESLGRPITWD
jgi:hypothetical protein